ncbi:hypothetical protein GCM10010470_13260 [Saccharopolyspora taberi]|uniref:Uncharacterized protein n=1 Tax=Saccharopolyspora taberi TaxID=60895 RepID=A0ABN3V6R6_9PSEU
MNVKNLDQRWRTRRLHVQLRRAGNRKEKNGRRRNDPTAARGPRRSAPRWTRGPCQEVEGFARKPSGPVARVLAWRRNLG